MAVQCSQGDGVQSKYSVIHISCSVRCLYSPCAPVLVQRADQVDSLKWHRFHQMGTMEQHSSGHVPRGIVQMLVSAAQGGSAAQLPIYQGGLSYWDTSVAVQLLLSCARAFVYYY